MGNRNGIGIANNYLKTANQTFTSNATLASILLGNSVAAGDPANGIPIAANQRMKIRYWILFSVGATGGIRFQPVVPAGGTVFGASYKINNTVAPSQTIATAVSSAVVTNALANAGTHWLELDVYVENGATAGTVDLQMAQNTVDVLTLTILAGCTAEVIRL